MTGFGRGTGHHEGVLATVEIATVNRKQAEVVIQLPRELAELESGIRKTVLEAISRGRAQVSIKLERENQQASELKVDQDLALALQQALSQLSEQLGQDLSLSATDLLRQPGVITTGDTEMDAETAMGAISPALSEAITALQAMRSDEGSHLKDDFLARIETLKGFAASLAETAPGR